MNAPTQIATVTEQPRRSVLIAMSTKYNMEPAAFEQTLRATVVPASASKEQFAAFLVVANEYGLNPLTKEIYAFPTRAGGIQPIVSIDGWCNLINSHPTCNGIEFDDHLDGEGKVTSITARIWRKDREKPTIVTEYMTECARPTEPWTKWPRRMLRHKALIQCARYAFGFAGIIDPDEAERMGADVSRMRDVAPRDDGPPTPPGGKAALPAPQSDPVAMMESGRDDGSQAEWSDNQAQSAGEDIPGFLRRNGDNKQAFDETQWLKDLAGALSSCEDIVSLGEKQNTVMRPAKPLASPDGWRKAEQLMRDNFARINGTMLDAG